MPIDPVTGESLPYAGEPGAAPGAPPPAAAPPAGAPPAGAAPMSPEEEQMMQLQELASQAPEPSKPYSVKAIETLTKEFNSTLDSLGGQDLPDIEVDLSAATGKKWETPLPGELFVGLIALNEALKAVAEGKFAEKYGFDPMELTDDTALRKATAQVVRMGKDKKLAEAMQEPVGPEAAPEAGPPPRPGEMTGEEEELASAMA